LTHSRIEIITAAKLNTEILKKADPVNLCRALRLDQSYSGGFQSAATEQWWEKRAVRLGQFFRNSETKGIYLTKETKHL
jgi:hypothetical protein